jgi:phosphoglycolate phosphatase-like HAD superfamily hydrolase
MHHSGYRIKAVLFDFDGTLTQPGAIDFKSIKADLGCPPDCPLLEYIQALPRAQDQRQAMRKLNRFEAEGAAGSRPNIGAQRIVTWIKQHRLPVAIITRNSRDSVLLSLENFEYIGPDDFDIIITRDDPLAPKPSGDGIVWAAEKLGVATAQVLMVGDFIFDFQSGRAAGALTAMLDPVGRSHLQSVDCDFKIQRLDELRSIIRAGLPLYDNAHLA